MSKEIPNDQKAKAALADVWPAGLRPVELEKKTGLNHNTAKDVVKRLLRDGFAEKKGAVISSIPQD